MKEDQVPGHDDTPEPARPGRSNHADDQAGGAAPADHEDAYELLQRGQALMARRHHAQAAIILERADRLEPLKGSILESLGRAYFMSNQVERAASTFRLLLEVDPSSHYAHYALGRSLARLGRHDEGRTHMRLAVALHPASRLYRSSLERFEPGARG